MYNLELSKVNQCDCCGKSRLTKTFMIDTYCGTAYLGYKCCGKWFQVNLSGNKFYALLRLEEKLKQFTTDELDEIFHNIRTSEREWRNK